MAQTNQEISLKLTVESAGFNEKLLEARKALYALEAAGVKAAGGQVKYSAAVKKARLAVKQANAAYRGATTSLQLHEIQARKTANAVTKLGKNQKRSNMAMTQAAYAIDDMQYGFQGVQNNIQAMAVSMGASGPLVIGLTAVTVAVGLFVKKLKKQNKAAEEAKKVLKDADGTIAAMMLYASVADDATASTETQQEALDKLVENGYDPLIGSVTDYIEKLREQARIESEVAKHQSKVQDLLESEREAREDLDEARNPSQNRKDLDQANALFANPKFGKDLISDEEYVLKLQEKRVKEAEDAYDTARKTTEEYIKQNKINTTGGTTKSNAKTGRGEKGSKDTYKPLGAEKMGDNYYKSVNKDVKEHLELMKAEGASKEELIRKEIEMMEAMTLTLFNLDDQENHLHKIKVLKAELANMPGIADNMVGLSSDEIGLEKFKNDLEAVRQMLDLGIISFDEYISRVDNLTEAHNGVNAAQSKTIDVGGMLTGQLSELVSGFAEAAGSGDNMGNALLKGLGNMLVQLGGLIIAAGVAALNLTITLSNPAMAPLAIAAGAALVAAGAAVSSFANKAGGGGGGSSSARASSGSSSKVINNPVRENARVRNSNLIIPMDMMRFGLQGANDNYSGFN